MIFISVFISLLMLIIILLKGSEIKRLRLENGIYRNNQQYIKELVIILEKSYLNDTKKEVTKLGDDM